MSDPDFGIALCDDDTATHSIVEEIISSYYSPAEKPVLYHYYSGKAFLDEGRALPVVLMDIAMPEFDGIQTSRALRNVNPNVVIIMLTSKTERFKEAFMIGASRFVTKPIRASELLEVIESARRAVKNYGSIDVVVNGQSVKLNQRSIYMIEAARNNVVIYLYREQISVRMSFRKIRKEMADDIFLDVHKSYCINMLHIKQIRSDCLILDNDVRAEISVRKRNSVRERIMLFDAARS